MKRILIAEDDEATATILEHRLNAAGYDVQILEDAFTAYLQTATDPPDALLLDINLPSATGLALAQNLDKLRMPPVPIVFMTASRDDELRKRARELGAVAYLEKPFSTETLLAAVAQCFKDPIPCGAA